MKKLLLSIFALAAMSAYAQDVHEAEILDEMQQTQTEVQDVDDMVTGDVIVEDVILPESDIVMPDEQAVEVEELPVINLKKQKRDSTLRAYTPARKYINLSIATQKLEYSGSRAMKSKSANSIEFGSTFFFNRHKPVVTPIGALRFGLDYSYMDITYATFELKDKDHKKVTSYFGNIGMQIGPSVTVTPIKKLNIRLYGHYAPSFVVYTPDKNFKEVSYGYAGYLTGGLQASYMFITLGVEMRGATANMATFKGLHVDSGGFEDEIGDIIGGGGIPDPGDILDPDVKVKVEKGPKKKAKLPGVRFIIGFRF